MDESPAITIDDLEIPFTVKTLDGFRKWFASFGEHAPHASFIGGKVFIETTPQSVGDHEPVVGAINRTLASLSEELDLGRYFFPPTWVTCEEADLSCEPDGFLVAWDRFESGAFRVPPERMYELLGAPTMTLEALSKSSTRKDLVTLAEKYFAAGVDEYWIADGRDEKCDLKILVRSKRAFKPQRASRRWLASPVFGRSFRLTRSTNRAGLPVFTLEVR